MKTNRSVVDREKRGNANRFGHAEPAWRIHLRMRRKLVFMALCLAAFLISGYAGEGVAAEGKPVQAAPAPAGLLAQFNETLDGMSGKDQDEQAILDLMRTFRGAHERHDSKAVENILSDDFEFHYFGAIDRIRVQDRSTFLSDRKEWKQRQAPSHRFVVSVKDLTKGPDGKEITVTCLTTRASKYFNPRFDEIYIFRRGGDAWKLGMWVIVPIYVASPELSKVQIIVAQYATKRRFTDEDVGKRILEGGPDIIVDEYLGEKATEYPVQHGFRPILYIFKEPPAPGATVRIEERHYGTWGDYKTDKDYRVEENTPYFFIVGHSFGNFRMGDAVDCQVFLDGALVQSANIPVY